MYSLLTPVAVLVMSQLHQHRPHPLLLYQVKAWLSLQNLQSEHRGPLKCQSCCLVALSLETNISRRQNLYGHDPASQTIPVSFRHPCHPDIDFTLADCSDNVSWTHSSRRDTCHAISIISWGWRGGERGKPPRSPDWPTCAVRYSARAKLKHKWSSNFLFLPALNFSFVSMRDWIWRAQENANSICWYTLWYKAFKKMLSHENVEMKTRVGMCGTIITYFRGRALRCLMRRAWWSRPWKLPVRESLSHTTKTGKLLNYHFRNRVDVEIGR